MKIKKEELKSGFWIFGNKGNVWSDNAHIFQSNGLSNGRTLCGVPMLSTNWAKLEEVQHIGCPECIKIYTKTT